MNSKPGCCLESVKNQYSSLIDVKFMVFGPRNVGKSTLISRFLIDHVFEEKRDFMNEGIRKLMM